MIGIRVDANSKIGTGHLMRCLSIASEVKRIGKEVLFITTDKENLSIINSRGYSCIIMEGKYTDLEKELSVLKEIIKEKRIKILLLDSYFVTIKYMSELQKKVKLFYIDDLHEKKYPCDMLLNYTVFAHKYNYSEEYSDVETKLLLGCSYVPLREEYSDIAQKVIHQDIRNVLILTGGTDACHFALRMVELIRSMDEWADITFHVICGRFNQDYERITEIAGERNIQVYSNLPSLSALMQKADIAISAGGTTLYELAACATPTIGYTLADNQMENLQTFAEEGYMLSVGDIRKKFPKQKIIKCMQLLENEKLRVEMSAKLKTLVDGKGCKRLAESISAL